MTQQRILDAAFRTFKQSGSQKSFSQWLERAKSAGYFWSA